MALTLGIDVACRAAHQATLARDGSHGVAWPEVLDPAGRSGAAVGRSRPARSGELTVVVEPTRNAWIVVAEWFRRRGARVVMVPTTQSADLRKYYSKHTKNDRIDSELLARLPLLHPEGLREYSGAGTGRPVAAAGQAALHDGQAPGRGLCPARRAASSCSARLGTRCWARTTASPRWSSWPATPTRTP